MRFLLISDTHGKLALLDELAAELGAEALIHAGDFGIFDEGSAKRLSERELRIQVVHSDLPRTEKDRILGLSRNAVIAAVRQHRLLGSFQSLLDGSQTLRFPVQAVWGKHEDIHVVERLHRGEIAIDNVSRHIIDHYSIHHPAEKLEGMDVAHEEGLLFLVETAFPPGTTGMAQTPREHPGAPITPAVRIAGDAQVSEVHFHESSGGRVPAHHCDYRLREPSPEVSIDRTERTWDPLPNQFRHDHYGVLLFVPPL
jgi:hypothetical protein